MRRLLVALLAASTILFAVGVVAEPSSAREPAAHEESGEAHEETAEGGDNEYLAGVDIESAAGAASRAATRHLVRQG